MKLEEQVCSLDLSKKLFKLLGTQQSLFLWTDGMRFDGDFDLVYKHAPVIKEGGGKINTFSAFTVAELGGLLNEACSKNFDDSLFQMLGATNGFIIGLADINHTDFPTIDSWTAEFLEPSEADARAKMLIYLLENGLISSGAY